MSAPDIKKQPEKVEEGKQVDQDLSNFFNVEALSDINVLNPGTNITYK
jgi:hypothetical protein